MELVEFMSNKECVVETFKVNGLIAKDNTVTEKGLMAIQFYLDMIEQKKPELENCQTAYMSCSEGGGMGKEFLPTDYYWRPLCNPQYFSPECTQSGI